MRQELVNFEKNYRDTCEIYPVEKNILSSMSPEQNKCKKNIYGEILLWDYNYFSSAKLEYTWSLFVCDDPNTSVYTRFPYSCMHRCIYSGVYVGQLETIDTAEYPLHVEH